MGHEEKSRLGELRPTRFLQEKRKINYPETRTSRGLFRVVAGMAPDLVCLVRSIRRWRRKGADSQVGTNQTTVSLEFLSMNFHSVSDFLLGLLRRPKGVRGTCRALMPFVQSIEIRPNILSGVKRVFLGERYTGSSFLCPRLFGEVVLSRWVEMCSFLVERGLTPVLHFDSDWIPFYHYLRELAAGRHILTLDGTSDIFQAKGVLGDHICLTGDVPASALLKLGEPGEVEAYCGRLIGELSSDGGFVLSSGCPIPIDARPGNVRALLRSLHLYTSPQGLMRSVFRAGWGCPLGEGLG